MVRAKKYLGQHFLTDVSIAARIAGALHNESDLPVLEIGPGTGVLTRELVKRNFRNLTLVEIDGESVEYLKENFDSSQFALLEADFLKMDLNAFCDSEMCIIGNFPYNISSQIFFKALENREKVSEIVCMIQKEVAERIGLCFDKIVFNDKVRLAPEVISTEVQEGKIILTLDQPVQPGELYGFEIAGDDGKYHNAAASSDGSRINVQCSMFNVQSLRYAWKDDPQQANVRSLSGLPMSSFELKINQ